MTIRMISITIVLFLITACGGQSSEQTQPAELITTYTGQFVDNEVIGLKYKTSTEEGVTNATGEFIYQLNEQVTFSIGDIAFPQVLAARVITPLDIFQTADINNVAVVNMLRLLQTLDEDGDVANGINISEQTHQAATGIIIDFSSNNFDTQVEELVINSGTLNTQLITAAEAVYHFQQTLYAMNGEPSSTCGSDHEKVGYSGFFTTLAHNVAGKAEIIDNCTIKISQFSYDGGGPEVYFYGSIDHDYQGESAFGFSGKLSGTVYNDGEIILSLPNGKTLDDLNGLSVWCVDFNANFGEVSFTP